MRAIGRYILSAGMAALLVSIIRSFCDSKSGIGKLICMVCGLFLAFVLIKPLKNLDIDRFEYISAVYTAEASAAADYGRELASDWQSELIKAEAEAYILDKAKSYGCDIQVEIEISDQEVPLPVSATITGQVPPYVQRNLEAILEADLGIHKERQQWTGTE